MLFLLFWFFLPKSHSFPLVNCPTLQAQWRSFQYEDLDFHSIGLSDKGVDIDQLIAKEHEDRRFLAFTEDWEQRSIGSKDSKSEILSKRKYGGIRLYKTDLPGFQPHIIDNLTVKWYGGKDFMCWCVLVRKDELVTEDNKEAYEPWKITSDLHFMIRSFYKKNPGELLTFALLLTADFNSIRASHHCMFFPLSSLLSMDGQATVASTW